MKKLVLSLVILAGFAMQALAYDFQSGDLLYTIISTDPPQVSLDGHVDGQNAQGELIIPELVEYEGVRYEVKSINKEAFWNCSGLTGTLVLPESLIEICEMAFGRCTGFVGELHLPQSLTKIKYGAFFECSGFTGTLVIPDSVIELGDTDNLHYFNYSVYLGTFMGCVGFNHLVLPRSLKVIGVACFADCINMTDQLVLPEGLVKIKYGSFTNCSGFTGELIIPNSVTEIGLTDNDSYLYDYGTFMNCTGFSGLMFSDSLSIIGISSFEGWHQHAGRLVLPDSVKEIAPKAFFDCSGFSGALVLGKSIQFIGNSAFFGCSSLTGELIIPESVLGIDYLAFSNCCGIESIILPSHYVFVSEWDQGYGVFDGCTGLTSVEIPSGWDKTGRQTFARCSNLASVVLPEDLRFIMADCFKDCINLSEINVPQGLLSIGNHSFSNCHKLESFDFPESLTEIAGSAFSHCTSLNGNLVIPNSVERIASYTFDSCVGYHSLVIGKSVNWLAEPAFDNTRFEKIIIKADSPPEFKRMQTSNAWHFPFDIPITVPCGAMDAYHNAEGWCEFTNIREGVTDILSLLSSDESVGIASILKEATCEDRTVEVEAIPNEGCAFMYWVANGERVSSENPYSFVLEEDTELVAYFSGTGVDEMEQKFVVYPNPTSGLVNITGHEFKSAEVFNTLGQHVATATNDGDRLTVDLGGLPVGVYFVNVTDEEGQKCVRKVVKE